MIEIVGILAGVFILISLIFPSTSIKSNILMRSLNLCGSILFVIYGLLVPAYSTAIVNTCTICLNLYYIIILLRKHVKNQSNNSDM